jgi:hypothetical protein
MSQIGSRKAVQGGVVLSAGTLPTPSLERPPALSELPTRGIRGEAIISLIARAVVVVRYRT